MIRKGMNDCHGYAEMWHWGYNKIEPWFSWMTEAWSSLKWKSCTIGNLTKLQNQDLYFSYLDGWALIFSFSSTSTSLLPSANLWRASSCSCSWCSSNIWVRVRNSAITLSRAFEGGLVCTYPTITTFLVTSVYRSYLFCRC